MGKGYFLLYIAVFSFLVLVVVEFNKDFKKDKFLGSYKVECEPIPVPQRGSPTKYYYPCLGKEFNSPAKIGDTIQEYSSRHMWNILSGPNICFVNQKN